jgi:hypothetical protein
MVIESESILGSHYLVKEEMHSNESESILGLSCERRNAFQFCSGELQKLSPLLLVSIPNIKT